MITVCGTHGVGSRGSTLVKVKGNTSTRQRCPLISPEKLPGRNVARSGNAVSTARAVSISMRLVSIERAPRTVVAINDPIAASATAITASATTTSIRVKPAVLRRRLDLTPVERGKLDPSRQPVDPDLVAG